MKPVTDDNIAKTRKQQAMALLSLVLGGGCFALTLFPNPLFAAFGSDPAGWQILGTGLAALGIAGLIGIAARQRHGLNTLVAIGKGYADYWITDAAGKVRATGNGPLSRDPGLRTELSLRVGEIINHQDASYKLDRHEPVQGLSLLIADDISGLAAEASAARQQLQTTHALACMASDWHWHIDAGQTFTSIRSLQQQDISEVEKHLNGRRLIEVMDVRRAPSDIRNLMRHIHDQEPFGNVIAPVRLNGIAGQRWLRLSGRPDIDASGGFKGYFGTATDVTEQHEETLQSRFQTRALRDAIESISEGLALFTADGQFVMCNRRLANDFASMAHLLNPSSTLDSLFNGMLRAGHLALPEDAPLEARAALVRELDRAQMRREFVGRKGRWFSSVITRSADESIVMVLSDITSHKNHEAELGGKIEQLEKVQSELISQKETLSRLAESLAHARNQAEAASRAKSEFLAAMSHELRTPLNAIIGFSEVMVSESLGALGNDRYRDYSRDIQESGRHLLAIINNILDLSRADAGKLDLQLHPLSLVDVIEASLKAARPTEPHARVTIDVAADVQEIVADPAKLRQIMTNLVSNALKFTDPDGQIEIQAWRLNGATRIEVRDTGIGMSPEDIPKALLAFRQVDSSLGRKFEGTGLGLPLALRFAHLHDGDLTIDSTLGKGTRITVDLPDKTPKAAVA